ncbi:MAG: general secretion pathway protein GspE [Myxococcales bacterium]|nr:general secretion pathway protein GspE [Myxococcales bacterium]
MATIKLGELLVKANVLTESQLKSALAEQKKWGGKLGEILVRMSLITEDLLVKALAKQLNIPPASLDQIEAIPPHVKAKLPVERARDIPAVPLQLRDEGKTLLVAMAEPQDVRALDTLRAVSRCRIVPLVAGRTSIARAIARFYEGETEVTDYEGSFKMVDAQGKTMVRGLPEKPPPRPVSLSDVPAARPPPPANPSDPAELLRSVEEVQRKEVALLKAMVELLIEKGVFTRDEYLAKVRR